MLRTVVLAFAIVGSVLGGPLSRLETAHPKTDQTKYRLPKDIVPEHYELELTPDIANERFTGSLNIIIEAVEATNAITLHLKDLTIPNAKTAIKIVHITEQITVTDAAPANEIADQEFYKISLDKSLTKGVKYILQIPKFEGTLNSNKKGFYIAKYKEDGKPEEKFATTQFEATSARMAFPCFDEPALKATFKISIVTPAGYNSVSNMDATKITPQADGTNIYEFETIKKVSTYLLAFVVSKLSLTPIQDRQRVLAKQTDIQAGRAKFAVDTGQSVLRGIENFLHVPYTLPKIDQAAIPDDYFSAGAMENWGLVTYRETYLLYDDKTTLTSRHQSIATIIAHEYGHQWFGNLVTPEWWQYIWLNEGFATYFEHRAADIAQDKWRIMDQFVVENTQLVFQPDSLETTRPMNTDAGSPSDIMGLFDRIAYEKSGSVIRMMEMFLTTEVFQKGLKKYLDRSAFKAVTPDILYDNLQEAVNEATSEILSDDLTVSKIMKTWDSAPGYPVVKVDRQYDQTENNVVLEQSRFLLNKAEGGNKNTWTIPINFATKSNKDFAKNTADKWLKENKMTVTLTDLSSSDWLLVNKRETGYYRVNYDDINWNLLIDALEEKHDDIDPLNRAQIIDDSFNLARSKRLSYNIPLRLMSYLSKETDYIPLYSYFNAINFLHPMISGSQIQNSFQDQIKDSLSGVYQTLGFDEKGTDQHLDKLNRISVLKWLCDIGHEDCRTKSSEKFQLWKNNKQVIPVNLQSPVFCGAMRTASQADWDLLYNEYKIATDAQLRSRMFSALGCSENTEILNGFLEKAIEGTDSLNAENVFSSVYNAGPIGIQTSLDYISNDFDKVHTKLQGGLSNVLKGIAAKLSTQEQLDQLNAMKEAHPDQKDLIEVAIARGKENIDWNNNNLQDILNYYTKDDGDGGGSVSYMQFSIFVTTFSVIVCTLLN